MDIKLFFNKLTEKLELGKIIEEPTQVGCGQIFMM